jgi:hypothetical protein
VLSFVGNSFREGNSWAECKSQLLERYFLYFVRERLVRERVVFYFHKERQPLCQYIEGVFRTAKFLNYQATEEQLVDRVVINFHPSISVHTALLDRPRSLKDLYSGRVDREVFRCPGKTSEGSPAFSGQY